MVTITNANNALKEVYLGVVSEQLNTGVNPLLARIKQTTADVWGKEIRKVAPYGLNGGIGAGTEDGNLPAAGGNNYVQFVSELKNLLIDKGIIKGKKKEKFDVTKLDETMFEEIESFVIESGKNWRGVINNDVITLLKK